MHSTNYTNTFILVAEDCPAETGSVPPKPDSIAGLQLALLQDRPYELTSDDLLFEVHARRKQIVGDSLDRARADFFSRPLACLRASPLVKQYGWGLHHDDESRVAAIAVGTAEYDALAEGERVRVVTGMRNARRGR